jgi:hypothetical protein
MVKKSISVFIGDKIAKCIFTFSSGGNGSRKFFDILSIVVISGIEQYFSTISDDKVSATNQAYPVFALRNGESVHKFRLSSEVINAFKIAVREAGKYVQTLVAQDEGCETIYNGEPVFISNIFAQAKAIKFSSYIK